MFDPALAAIDAHLDEQEPETITGECESCGRKNRKVYFCAERQIWWCADSFDCSLHLIEIDNLERETLPF